MAVIDHLDIEKALIYLAVGVRTYHPVEDIYKEMRTLRRTDMSARGFIPPVTAMGNIAKGGGKYTPRLAIFENGWKIVPEDVSHTLYISGEQINDEGGSGPDCVDMDELSASSKVVVHYEPPSAEIIATNVSGLTEGESTQLMGTLTVKKYLGLK